MNTVYKAAFTFSCTERYHTRIIYLLLDQAPDTIRTGSKVRYNYYFLKPCCFVWSKLYSIYSRTQRNC